MKIPAPRLPQLLRPLGDSEVSVDSAVEEEEAALVVVAELASSAVKMVTCRGNVLREEEEAAVVVAIEPVLSVARKVICRENVPAPAEEEVAVITPVFVAAKRGIGRLIALTQPREVAAVITPVFVAAKPGIGRLIAPTHPREEEEEEALVTNAARRDTCRGSVPPVAGTLALGAGKRDTESRIVPTRLKAVVGMGAARAGNAERKDILRGESLFR